MIRNKNQNRSAPLHLLYRKPISKKVISFLIAILYKDLSYTIPYLINDFSTVSRQLYNSFFLNVPH